MHLKDALSSMHNGILRISDGRLHCIYRRFTQNLDLFGRQIDFNLSRRVTTDWTARLTLVAQPPQDIFPTLNWYMVTSRMVSNLTVDLPIFGRSSTIAQAIT
jgi:hypothetical protein